MIESPDWLADELFGQHAIVTGAAAMPSASLSQERGPVTTSGHTTDGRSVAAPADPEDALLERAIGIVRSVFNKGP